jgi:hypothetical protein
MRRRLRPEDLTPSAQELSDARTSQTAQGTGGMWGSALGTAVGGGLGALGILGGPAVAGVTIPLGMQIGGAAGGALGTAAGGAAASVADERLKRAADRRARLAADEEERRAAIRALLSRRDDP